MKTRLLSWWEALRTSFWFVPSLMALAAAGLSAGTIALDTNSVGKKLADSVGWLWSGGAEGARTLLSTVASSMITVAGTVFSITIAALTLASSQFGPRLLRNFTRDLGNQLVLGTFVATYLYCLLILRTVRGVNEGNFVPYVSVTCGMLLAIASIGVLVYFIHHVANSIQAESLVALIGEELRRSITRMYPPHQDERNEKQPEAIPPTPASTVWAEAGGYVQDIDRDGLLAAAEKDDLLIRVLRRPGDFVSCGDALLQVWAGKDGLSENQVARLRGAFGLGPRRTPTQDVRYGVRQLTEIASRALSPGINDPFTAMGCTDWLVDALAEAARHDPALGCRLGADGEPRLLEKPVDFAELAHLSINPLRAYGASSVMVVIHLLHSLARLVAQVDRAEDRATLLVQAEQTAAAARQALGDEVDLRRVQDGLNRVHAALADAVG